MKKYFFFDIDGTLSPGGTLCIPKDTQSCLEGLRASGHFTALTTGRLLSNAQDFAEKYGFEAVVADGGQSASLHGRLLFMESLPVQACAALTERLDAAGIPWAVSAENSTVRLTRDGQFTAAAGESYFETRIVPGLEAAALPVIYKIFIACSSGQQAAIDLGGLPAVRFNTRCLFIEPTDKARGIRRLMAVLGAPCERVVVFGDGDNDCGMFCPEWTSIAMGNACAALKQRADYVTDDCDRDGIGKACRRFGWL